MNLSNILPVLFVFIVWGIKPGPHTITLLLRTVHSGVRSALLIALGNNIIHLCFFWISIFTLTYLHPGETFLFWARITSGVFIITISLYEAFIRVTPPINGKNGRTVSIAMGIFVGLSNPLNISFYLGVMPEVLVHDYSHADVIVMSFLVFFALFSGQALYIAFADGMKYIFVTPKYTKAIWMTSNLIFSLVGFYFIYLAF